MTALPDRLHSLYHYKLKTVLDLVNRGEFGYLTGVLTEQITDRNVYLDYLRAQGHDLTVDREILGHRMTLDLSDPGLSRYLIVRGVNEPDATPAFIEALQSAVSAHPSNELTVLDIGANLGYFTLLEAAVLGGRGTVHAFEPVPENRGLLERNVQQNDYGRSIRIRPSAISDRDGWVKLVLSDHSNWHRVTRGAVDDRAETLTVSSRRVDSFLNEEELDPESVVGVRMDVEGHESAIFEGMKPILDAESPLVLFVELHPSELTEAERDRILSSLRDGGFSVRFAGQDRRTFEVKSFDEIKEIEGSHLRLVLHRSQLDAKQPRYRSERLVGH